MKRDARAGFTLIEMMIVVAMVGILGTLAIYSVRKYIANSKSTEARNFVALIAKDAQMGLEGGQGSSTNSAALTNVGSIDPNSANTSASQMRSLCPQSAPVPATIPTDGKYQSQNSDWAGDPGWMCLKFSIAEAQYYQYEYSTSNTSAVNGGFTSNAYGDLNGNGVTSHFSISGSVQGGLLLLSGLGESLPEE